MKWGIIVFTLFVATTVTFATGSSNVKVKLYWNENTCDLYTLSTLKMARLESGTWKSIGAVATSGNTTAGNIVTNSNLSSFDTLTIGKKSPQVSALAGTDKAICQWDSTGIGASPAATGGVTAYTYAWTPATGLSSTTTANPRASPTATTTYILTVTDADDCVGRDTMVVTVNANPIAYAGVDTGTCFGTSIQIGTNPAASGGASSYTYVWSPGIHLNDSTVAQPTALDSTTTQYLLTVTDQNGCTAEDAMLLTIYPLPIADANVDQHVCLGQHAYIGGNTSSGSRPYQYIWKDELNRAQDSVSFREVYPDSSHTYYLTVIDAKGCMGWDTMSVTVSPALSVVIDIPESTFGLGDNITLGDDTLIRGGTAPYHIFWTDGDAWTSDDENPVVTPSVTTVYNVMITDTAGCQAHGTQVVLLGFPKSEILETYSLLSNKITLLTPVVAEGKIGYVDTLIGDVYESDSVLHNEGSVPAAMADLAQLIDDYFALPVDEELTEINSDTLTSGVYHFTHPLIVDSTMVFDGDASSYFIMLADSGITFNYGTRTMLRGVKPEQVIWVSREDIITTDTVALVGNFMGAKSFMALDPIQGDLSAFALVEIQINLENIRLAIWSLFLPKDFQRAVISSVTHELDYFSDDDDEDDHVSRQTWWGNHPYNANEEENSDPVQDNDVFNGGFNDKNNYLNWTRLNASFMRFGGRGWDWNSGEPLNERQLLYPGDLFDFPSSSQISSGYHRQSYTVPDDNHYPSTNLKTMRSFLRGSNAKLHLDMNVSTKVDYTLLLAKQATDLGMPLKEVELYNEPYYPADNAANMKLWNNGTDYAKTVAYCLKYFNTNASLFPDGLRPKVGISASSPYALSNGDQPVGCRYSFWDQQLGLPDLTDPVLGSESISDLLQPGDAFTFHFYPDGGITKEADPDHPVHPAYIPFYTDLKDVFYSAFDFIDAFRKNEISLLSSHPGIDAWITEYNMTVGDYNFHGTWANGLYQAAFTMAMLEEQRITRAIGFNFLSNHLHGYIFNNTGGYGGDNHTKTFSSAGGANPATIAYGKTAVGIAMTMLSEAMYYANDAVKIDFPDAPVIKQNMPYKTLYGWRFNPATGSGHAKQAVILNLGGNTASISLKQIMGDPIGGITYGYEIVYCFNNATNYSGDYLGGDDDLNPILNGVHGGSSFTPIAYCTGDYLAAYYSYNNIQLDPNALNNSVPMKLIGPRKSPTDFAPLPPYSIIRIFEIMPIPEYEVSSNSSCATLPGAGADDHLKYFTMEQGGTDAINLSADGAAKYEWVYSGPESNTLRGNSVFFCPATAGDYDVTFKAYNNVSAVLPYYTDDFQITVHNPPMRKAIDENVTGSFCKNFLLETNNSGQANWWSPTGNVFDAGTSTLDINTDNVDIKPHETTTYYYTNIDNDNKCYNISYYDADMTNVTLTQTFKNISPNQPLICIKDKLILRLEGSEYNALANYSWTAYSADFETQISLDGLDKDPVNYVLEINFSDLKGFRYILCTIEYDGCTHRIFHALDDAVTHPNFVVKNSKPVSCINEDIVLIAEDSPPKDFQTKFTWNFNPSVPSLSSVEPEHTDPGAKATIQFNSSGTKTFSVKGRSKQDRRYSDPDDYVDIEYQHCDDVQDITLNVAGNLPDYMRLYDSNCDSVTRSYKDHPNSIEVVNHNQVIKNDACKLPINVCTSCSGTCSNTCATCTYSWNPIAGIEGNGTASVTLSPTVSTIYELTIGDFNPNNCGCCTKRNQYKYRVHVNTPFIKINEAKTISKTNLSVEYKLELKFLQGNAEKNCPLSGECSDYRWFTASSFTNVENETWDALTAYDNSPTCTLQTNIADIYVICSLKVNNNYSATHPLYGCDHVIAYSKLKGIIFPFAWRMESDKEEGTTHPSVSVYPNPSIGKFHLSLSQLPEDEDVTVELYNVQGSKLYRKVIAAGANNVLLDLPESIPAGIHFLRLSTSKDNLYAKIIIQRP